MDFSLKTWLPKHFLLLIVVGIWIAIIAPLQAAPIEPWLSNIRSPAGNQPLLSVPILEIITNFGDNNGCKFSRRRRWWARTELRTAEEIAGLGCQLHEVLQKRWGVEQWGLHEWHLGSFTINFMLNPSANLKFYQFCMASYHFIRCFAKWSTASESNCFRTRRTGSSVKCSVGIQNEHSAMYYFIHHWWVHSQKNRQQINISGRNFCKECPSSFFHHFLNPNWLTNFSMFPNSLLISSIRFHCFKKYSLISY